MNEVHGPSSTKYRQAKTGTHKAVKNKASVKQPAIKPKSIKNYQSSEKKNSQASGSMDQLTNKYQPKIKDQMQREDQRKIEDVMGTED